MTGSSPGWEVDSWMQSIRLVTALRPIRSYFPRPNITVVRATFDAALWMISRIKSFSRFGQTNLSFSRSLMAVGGPVIGHADGDVSLGTVTK